MKKLKIILTFLLLTFVVSGFASDDALSKQRKLVAAPVRLNLSHVQYLQKKMVLNPLRLSLGNAMTLDLSTGKLSVDSFAHLGNPLISNFQDADAKSYREAYKNILNEKWDEAVDALKKFREDYPKSRRLSSAEYWICFSREKLDYPDEEVFELYEEFIEKYPSSSWADDARSNMVRIGSELIRSGNREYEVKVQNIRREGDEALALAALYALGTDNEEEVLPQVIEMYDNTMSERIRKELVYILARFKSKLAADKLYEIIMNDPDVQIRTVAIHYLSEEDPEKLLAVAGELIWNESDEELIKSAVYTLPNIKLIESDNMLIKIVSEHPNPEIRVAAIHMLSEKQMRDPNVLKIMEDVIFKSDDIELKKTALYGLNRAENKKKDEL
ncbi:HEAT repeat domain-containing protein, partial [candidate division KSB1 bacterium]